MNGIECITDRQACGACCSDVSLPLDTEEKNKLERAGTMLVQVLPPMIISDVVIDDQAPQGFRIEPTPLSWADLTEDLEENVQQATTESTRETWRKLIKTSRTMRPGQGLYVMNGVCGFLQEDRTCGNYDDRPTICQNFEVGGNACQVMRARAVETAVEITRKPVSG